MVSERGKNETLDTIINDTEIERRDSHNRGCCRRHRHGKVAPPASEDVGDQYNHVPLLPSIYGLPSFHALLPSDSLPRPCIRGTGIDQLHNKSGSKVGESSTQSKLIDLSMYFKNSITSLPILSSNYITSSLAPTTSVFPREKLNG
ncbi:uncharacterized protein E5676_scaffold1017G00730 [Cucumis melo var. makuwa]|uniref:Uncharacterized protein n=1 Tax=Cucumis melo var. makuwa TaxID=1194695 RepID=A0A5D3CLP8_CUCMM|nr:uncharacterized protein E6C27_scaffold477G00200 [Cucumis melo var. makuwa]TYK12058.1 uncharacterized protein E5676_scaffold1017G00730 [Cucumis melo var. makuwa]